MYVPCFISFIRQFFSLVLGLFLTQSSACTWLRPISFAFQRPITEGCYRVHALYKVPVTPCMHSLHTHPPHVGLQVSQIKIKLPLMWATVAVSA